MTIGEGERVEARPSRRRSLVSRGLKRLGRSPRLLRFVGGAAARYIRLVGAANKVIYEGAYDYATYDVSQPVIVAVWHGQHLLLPAIRRKEHRIVALTSRHRDGELATIIAGKLGVETVRGSGARDQSHVIERGGIRAFLKLRSALKEGKTVMMTANNTGSRRAGLGVIKLARASGMPIAPVALATSRRVGSSDASVVLNLPLGRLAIVTGPFQHVPEDAADDALEEYRLALENELNRITDRAYAIADKKDG